MFPTLSRLRHSALIAMLAVALASACSVTATQAAEPGNAAENNRSLEIIRDCNDDGILQGADSYSAADLERARRELASDVDQYSDCRAVITAALHKKSKGDGGASGAGGAIPVTPEQRARFESVLAQEIAKVKSGAKPSIPIDGQTITPGAGSTFASNARPGTPFSLFLIAGLCLLAAIPGIYGGARILMARRGWQPRMTLPGGVANLRLPGKQATSRD